MIINLSDYDVDRVLLAIKCCMIELRLQETEPETPADEQRKLAAAQSKWNALYIDIERQKEQNKKGDAKHDNQTIPHSCQKGN